MKRYLTYLLLMLFGLYSYSIHSQIFSETFNNAWSSLEKPTASWSSDVVSSSAQAWHINNVTTNWLYTSSGSPGANGYSGGASDYYARFHSFGITSPNTTYLQTPAIDLSTYTTGGNVNLTFYYKNVDGTDVLDVYFYNGTTWTKQGASYTTAASWTQYTVSVSSTYLVSTFAIRFKAISDYGNTDIGLDQVAVTYTAVAPTITTTAISSIATTSATSGGNITSTGGATITVSGICWNTSTNPTTSNSKTTDGATSVTSFASNLSSLTAETYYYVRAYATNSAGTSYGSNVAFYTYSTEPTGHSATFSASAASSGTQVDLTFTAASTYGADGYIILRLAGATAPDNTNINDGTAPASLTMPGATVLVTTITNNATTTYSNTGLSANTQYSYAIIPYNWDALNSGTYNYRTSATISTCNATTPDVPTNEGLALAGNFVNNGTFDQSSDANYFSMTGSSKSITGIGIYSSTKMNVNGTITFDGTISSGSFSKTYVTSVKTFTVNTSKTYINGKFVNYGTTTLNASSTFKNSGDWTNNGTVTAVSTSTAEFNGTSAQNIGGTASTTFSNATINNSSTGVSLGINTTVNNTLTLTTGLLKTVSYTLTVGTNGANGTISGGSSSTYIVAYDNIGTIGYVKQHINSNTSYSFPIGDLSNYTPMTFTLTSATLSNAYITTYTKAVKVTGLNSSITQYVNRFWDVTPSGITSPTYTIAYTYVDVDIVGSEIGMLPIKKSGTTWYKPVGSSFSTGIEQGTGSLNAGTNTLTWSSLTTFSLFGGAVNGAVPLPIELTSFIGQKDGKNNILFWKTASEVNNDFFTIEKTTDGENFEVVGIEDGAGNSNQLLEYSLIDDDVRQVINYYRLKQTDFDGKFSYSDMLTIDNRINSTAKEVSLITNVLGQEVNEYYRGVVIIVYTDGTSIKVIQ